MPWPPLTNMVPWWWKHPGDRPRNDIDNGDDDDDDDDDGSGGGGGVSNDDNSMQHNIEDNEEDNTVDAAAAAIDDNSGDFDSYDDDSISLGPVLKYRHPRTCN